MSSVKKFRIIRYKAATKPVLKIKKVIKTLKKGEKLKIIATDPMIKIDLPTFCRESNCKLIYIKDTEESIFCEIQVL